MMLALLAVLACSGGPSEDATEVEAELAPVETGLDFGEGVTERERNSLRGRFDEALARACTPPPCVEDTCAKDEARLGVIVDGIDRDYTLRWQLEDPRLEQPFTHESSCELCSLADLEEQLAADLGSVCTRLGSLEEAPSRVRVTSDPSGASVRVDGKRVGKTPWVGELPAGEHLVELRAPGYVSEDRTFITVAGLEESEHVELMEMIVTLEHRPHWPGWMTLSLGVALGVAGTALIALDAKEWQARCSGTNVDALGNCRFVYSTAPLGISLAAIGAASFGTGVGLMVWAQRGGNRGGAGGVALRGSF